MSLSAFSPVADQVAQAVQQTLDATGQQLTVQLELRNPEGKKAWRTVCTYSGPTGLEPTRPVMQQLWDLAGLLEEPQKSNIRERLEMEAARG